MTIKEALRDAQNNLKEKQVSEPESSAEFLLRQVLGQTRAQFYAGSNRDITPKELRKFRYYIKRRLHHEPVWQIIGRVEFWGLDFAVNQNVLVPRPETEMLVEKVLQEVKKRLNLKPKTYKLLDVGTGAAPIICALATELKPQTSNLKPITYYASDVSGKALLVAKKNAKNLGLESKITFKKGGLLSPWRGQKFDIITANLPYIPHEDLGGLALEIHHYEPRVALDGGSGGLILYEEFLTNLPQYLNSNGLVFCEIGKAQGKNFQKLVAKYLKGATCQIQQDLAGLDRIAVIRL